MATQTATAEVLRELAGEWTIDPAHSSFNFSAKHMMFTTVRGNFGEFSGDVVIPEDPADSRVDIVMKSASIDTHNEQRDGHVRSPDFLDIEKFPEITYRAGGAEILSDSEAKLHGELTVRGVTKPVDLDVTLNGFVPADAFGMPRAGFSATTKVNRRDFGLTWNMALETGGVLLGDEIKIELDIAVTPKQEEA